MSSKTCALMALPLAALAMPAAAQTLPTGGSIVQGAGSVAVNGAQMVVKQDSPRLVADWHSFSIGAANAVRFVQPSADAVALNRVTGSDPSAIFGSLTANGHVYLQNPNGVLFAPGAQVSVGSLVATSLDVDAQAFMAGQLRLSGDASRGAVRNAGSLVTTEGGHVVLVAPQVDNSGSIATPGGTTALVAGSAVTIDPTGAGLLSISVPAAAVNARLEHSGTITADGGTVRLAAAAADAALGTVMQVGGVVRARRIEQRGGEIVLSGGGSGVVRLSGTLDASGEAAASGGSAKVLGERVALVGDARIDASGASGGTVLVGGNYQGHGPEQNARDTYVGAGSVIDASATRRGDGGTVVVWSDGGTSYAGRTLARGGAEGGNGGMVEVSGKGTLGFAGEVDLRAPRGQAGQLLLDPASIEIGTVADINNDSTTGDDLIGPDMLFDGSTNSSFITAGRVAQLLGTGNVTLQATNSIDLTAPLAVAPGGATSTLTLNSAQINLHAPMTLENSSLVADTGAPGEPFDTIWVASDVTSRASVSLTSQQILLDANVTAQNVALTTRPPMGGSFSSQVAQDSGTGITADTLTVTSLPGSVTSIGLGGMNQVDSLVFSNAISSTVNVVNPIGTPLAVSGSVASLNLTSASGITQTAPLAVSFGLTLNTTDAGATTGAVDLSNAGNSLGGGVSFNVASHLNLAAAGALSVAGSAGSAGGDITVAAGGQLMLSGNLQSTGVFGAPTVRLTGAGVADGQHQVLLPAGGRFLVRSSNYAGDSLIGLNPSLDYVVYGSGSIDPGTGNGYYTNRTATITPSAGDAPPISRVYDGTTAFAFVQTGTGGTLSEAGGGQSFSVTNYTINSTGNFTDKNAGTGKAYTVAASTDVTADTGGIVRYGASYAGFSRPAGVIGSPGHDTSEVTPLGITSTGLAGVDRVYDGFSTVAVNAGGATLTGVLAGDTVTLDATSAVGFMSDKAVGTGKAIAVSGLQLGGADGGNYTVTDASNATVTITPRALTSTGLLAIDRVYDGTATVAADVSGATLGGPIVPDDMVFVDSASGTMADKHVRSNKAVTMGNVMLAGNDAANYTVTDASNATVTITPRTVVATGINGLDRVYDGTTVVGVDVSGATLVNAVAGDDIALDASGATGTMADKNAGTGKAVSISGVTLAGADAGNYSVSHASTPTVDIALRPALATGINGIDRVYDGTTAVGLDVSGATLVNAVAGDDVALDISSATGTMADKHAGSNKAVTMNNIVLAGNDATNYTVTDASNATVTITPRALTSTGLLAVDRVYDGTTTVAADVSGATLGGPIVPSDMVFVDSASGTMADKHVGSNKAVTMDNVMLAGNDAANYTVTDVSHATVTITPRTVFATGISGLDRVYDGTTAVGVDLSGATLVNAVAGDDIALDASGATGTMADKNAGTGKAVSISGVTLAGADAGNYSVSHDATLTVDIATALLTPVGIGALDRVVDGGTGITLATGGAGLLGIVPGDVVGLDASGATGSVASPDAGIQPVSVTGLALTGPDAANYSLATSVLNPSGQPLAVHLLTPAHVAFEAVRYREYLQGVSDAQEPFRRAMAEALAAGFGKENIRKQLTRGLVFETGLAAPAVDEIDSAARPEPCSAGAAADGASLACGR